MGGSGAFGRRLVQGLAAVDGFAIVVAGRDLARATATARDLGGPRASAAALDTATVTPAQLRVLHAFAVVDAAGPFRVGEYRLARAAIDAGLHYVDLADGRAFVAGFAALDDAARAAGVTALTGASSTPALSCAVLDALTAGWSRTETVDVAILPGNRAPRGLAVMQSILSWTGRPVRVLLDGRWTVRPGWGLTRRTRIPGLGPRWASLAETPDLDVVPARYAVTRTALFRAGLELPILHLGMAALAIVARVVPLPLASWARPLRSMADWFVRFGTDRGGMHVATSGIDAGEQVGRSWTLIAEAGDGPVIPTLAALGSLRRLAAGTVPAGARPCVGLLTLDDFATEFAPYRITSRTSESRARPGPPLFARALGGPAFDALPTALQTVHTPGSWLALEGRASVEGAHGRLARVAAAIFRLPPAAADVAVRVTIEAHGDGERWTRDFAGNRFHSRLGLAGPGHLSERFGPFVFRLAVTADGSGLSLDIVGWRCGKVPMPRALAPRTVAREWSAAGGRFHFDVEIALPLAGRLVRYRGWLTPILHS